MKVSPLALTDLETREAAQEEVLDELTKMDGCSSYRKLMWIYVADNDILDQFFIARFLNQIVQN